jgi:hypothetical protein
MRWYIPYLLSLFLAAVSFRVAFAQPHDHPQIGASGFWLRPADKPVAAKEKSGEADRQYTREEIVATIPSDKKHQYPVRLQYLLSFSAVERGLEPEFLVTVHRGRDRPDRLAIWNWTNEDKYRRILVKESTSPELSEHFEAPKLFYPEGQGTSGEGVHFLNIRENVWRGVEDTLFAVDPEDDELRLVRIDSPERWYENKLKPGELFMPGGDSNSFCDWRQPAFEFPIWKETDAHGDPTAGMVTGTYKIIKEQHQSTDASKPWQYDWKFVVGKARREPMPEQ